MKRVCLIDCYCRVCNIKLDPLRFINFGNICYTCSLNTKNIFIPIDLTDEVSEEISVITRIITTRMRYQILSEQKWKCNNCGCRLKFGKHSNWCGEVAHIDHIHPFADRETYCNDEYNINERSNLQALCGKCNKIKGRRKN